MPGCRVRTHQHPHSLPTRRPVVPLHRVSFFNAIYNTNFNASSEVRVAWLQKFQGYGTPAVPPSGMPDPEFSPYHKQVFEFLKLRDKYIPK